jgi:hypothetical protein
MLGCTSLVPPASRDQPSDKRGALLPYPDHPAIRVCQKSYRANPAYCDSVRNIERVAAKVAARGAKHERKLVRDDQILPVIHAHPYQELSPATGGWRWLGKVVIAEQPLDRRASVCWENVGYGVDRDYLRHDEPVFPWQEVVGGFLKLETDCGSATWSREQGK